MDDRKEKPIPSPQTPQASINLANYDGTRFDRGRPPLIEALWLLVDALLVRSWLPGSAHRRFILRAFGAKIGDGVILKSGVRVKFPWRLEIGDHSWIGEDAWIDNLAPVKIGSDCCISQAAYICAGSHDWSSPAFDLITRPVTVGDSAWIAAKAIVAPGVSVGEGAVLTIGSVALANLADWGIYQGAPAVQIKQRVLRRRT